MRALVVVALVGLVFGGCASSDAPSSDDVGHDEDDHAGAGDPADDDAGTEEAPDAAAPVEAGAPALDAGHADAGAAACALVKPPHLAQLKWGLHPYASDGLRWVGLGAGDISQTIGNAVASAGTHAQDGTFMGYAYSATTDLRVGSRTEAQIAALLDKLAAAGFAAWYRKPGYDGWPSYDARHIHAIYVGAAMKLSLRNQVRDWMAGKNGLASHTTYKFHAWTKCQRDPLWAEFLKHNPAQN